MLPWVILHKLFEEEQRYFCYCSRITHNIMSTVHYGLVLINVGDYGGIGEEWSSGGADHTV